MTIGEVYQLICEQISRLEDIGEEYVLLVGTPLHTNIGDRAIAFAEHKFLGAISKRPIVEVPYGFELQKIKISQNILIVLHGGGNFGDLWGNEEEYRRTIIAAFPNNKIVLMPQTIFFSDNTNLEKSIELYSKHKDLTLIARERKSFDIMSEKFKANKVAIAPDIVLSLNAMRTFMLRRRKGVLFVMRADKERTVADNPAENLEDIVRGALGSNESAKYSDMHIEERDNALTWPLYETHKKITMTKLAQFRESKLVVTDRLHGMVFAALSGTPCIVFASKTHKTAGVYEWLRDGHYDEYIKFCDSYDEVIGAISSINFRKKYKYRKSSYEAYWAQLTRLLNGYTG